MNNQVTIYVNEITDLDRDAFSLLVCRLTSLGLDQPLCIVLVWVTSGGIPYAGIVLRDDPME
jgi:hypothetical protein